MIHANKKIIVFEEDRGVRRLLTDIVGTIGHVRDNHYAVEALTEPWSAKDQVDEGTELVLVGEGRSTEWKGLSYLRDIPYKVFAIAGSPSWTPESRNRFHQAGAIYTYDMPFRPALLKKMISAALVAGSFLSRISNGESILVKHLSGETNDFVTERVHR